MNLTTELIEIDKRFGLPFLKEGESLHKQFYAELSEKIKTLTHPINRKFAKVILSKVKDWFISNGFTYLAQPVPLSESFSGNKISCVGYSILYYSLGEENDLPIQCVNAPQHIFVRWSFGKKDYCNWETTAPLTNNTCFTNEREFAGKKITDLQLKNKIFLQELSREQIIARYYNLLGGYFEEQKDFDKAKECSESILHYDPKNPQGMNALASLISKSFPRELYRAKELFKESLKIDPESPNTNYNYGLYLKIHIRGSEQEQRKHFETALQNDPQCQSSRGELAMLLYHKLREKEEAIKLLEEGISLDSNNPFFYNSLGVFIFETYPDRNDDCKKYYEKAAELDPDNPIAYENLSELYEKRLNNPQKAKEYFILAKERKTIKNSSPPSSPSA